MNAARLDRLMESPWLERIGWTLLHFLWQGALVALLLAAILASLRRSSARVRYLAGVAAVAVAGFLPLATFLVLPVSGGKQRVDTIGQARVKILPDHPVFQAPSAPAEATTARPAQPGLESIAISRAQKAAALPARSAIRLWYRALMVKATPLLPWCATAWAIGVVLLSLRLLAGWTQVRRLYREGTRPANAVWQARLEVLCAKLRVARTIRLLESTLAEVPAVIGWLRPIILLPIGALAGLSTAQVEMILAHELAHVARQDHLVNLGLTLFETLGFYHPAVWWLAARVRQERENACDDLAVAVTGEDRLGYARALATLEERRATAGGLALAANSGGRGMLLARVRRLLGAAPPRQSGPGRSTWWLAGGIALVIAFALASVVMQRPAQAQDPVGKQPSLTAFLRGRVVDEQGKPVPGALVYDAAGHSNPVAGGLKEPALTDGNGFFLVPKLRYNHAWRTLGARLGDTALGWLETGAEGAPAVLGENGDIAKPIVLKSRRYRLYGICVDELGRPLAGATVAVTSLPAETGDFTLTPGRPEETISLFWEALATKSDAAGEFSLQTPVEDDMSVEISAPGHETVFPFETVAAGEHEVGDLGRVKLPAAGSIAGRVAFADGEGGKRSLQGMIFDAVEAGELQKAAGAGPAGWFGPPEHSNDSPSDAAGRYRIDHLPPGTYTVVLDGIDGATYGAPVTTVLAAENVMVRAGETTPLDLRAVTGRFLRVQAFDKSTGQPIRNRPFVHYEGPGRPPSAGLNYSTALTEAGEWRFEVPPGHSRVFLTGPIGKGTTELASGEVDVPADHDPQPVRLEVQEDAQFSLAGHVQDAQGRPIPLAGGAVIQLLGSGPDKGRDIGGGQSSNGTFQIPYQKIGTHVRLLVDVPGFRPWLSPEFVLTDKPEPMAVTLPECPVLTVRGRVLDQDGKPIDRANVLGTIITADGPAYTVRLASGSPGDELFTDPDGRFETRRLRVGDKFRLDVFAGGQEVSASADGVQVASGSKLDIQMNAIKLPRVAATDTPIGPTDLAGHVVDGQGKPVAAATVTVAGSFPELAPVITNAAGGFRFPEFGDRHYVYLAVEKAGFGTRWETDLTVGRDFNVRLDNTTRLRGVLLQPDGSPAGRATIVLRKNKPTLRPDIGNPVTGLRLQRESDERGVYDFPLEPGDYEAEITSANGDLVARDEGILVAQGQSLALPPTLNAGLTLRVQTVDSLTGKPASGVRFSIREMIDAYVIQARPGSERQSDAQGFVQWEHLFPGTTILEADRTGMYGRFWSIDDRETFHLNAPKGRPPVGNECASGSLFMNPVPGRTTEPIIVETERAVKIKGQVVDPDGKPAINVQVRAITYQLGQKPAGDEPAGDLPPFSAYTQDSFFSGYIPAGNGELTRLNGFPQDDSLASGVSEAFASAPGDSREVVVKLTRGGWIDGRVIDAHGKPLADVNVVATAQDRLDSYEFRPWTKTGSQGEFHFGPLRPAEYQVRTTTLQRFAAGNEPPEEVRLLTVTAGGHVQTGALHFEPEGWTAPANQPANAQAASSPTPAAADLGERQATFMATAAIEFQMPPWAVGHEPNATLDEELSALKANLPPDDTAIIVKRQADSSVFQVTSCGESPAEAADHTNEIVQSLQQRINGPGSKLPPCIIMNKAWAAEASGLFEVHAVATAQDKTARKYVLTRRDDKTETLYLEPAVLLDSSALQFAALAPERGGDQIIDVFLTKAGAERFGKITTQRLNERIAFVSGNQLLCAPVIRDPIYSRNLEVSGSIPAASDLVALFNANLKAPVPDPSPSPPAPPPAALTDAGIRPPGPISAEMLIVRVKVVDDNGQPVKGAKVTPIGLYSRAQPDTHFGWFAQGAETPPWVLTDSEGVAAVPYPRLTAGKFETNAVSFRAEHANFSAANAMDYPVQSDPTQSEPIVLRRGATLRVTGHLAGSPETVPVYPQSADPSDHWLSDAAWQDVGGNALENSQIHAGKTYLRLAHAASDGTLFFSDTILLSAAASETYTRDLELKPAVRLEGRLDDAVPRPVQHGRVVAHVYPTGPDAGAQWLGWDSWREVAPDGTFAFAGLPPGTLEVTAVCDGFISTSSPDPAGITYLRSVGPQRFPLPPAQTSRVAVQMSAGATCEIELRDAAGAPVSGATVAFNPNVHWTPGLTGYFCAGQLKMEDQLSHWREINYDRGQQDSRFSAVSDARGIATVRSLPPGQQLTFSVADDRYQMPKSTAAGMINAREAAVDLRAGETQHVTVQLEKKRPLVEETIVEDSDHASVQRHAPVAVDGHATFMASANVLILFRDSGPSGVVGEAFLKAHLPKVDFSATVKPLPQGPQFQVSACGATPAEAASRANQIVGSLHDQFSGSKPDEPIVGVTDPATASQAVNVFEIHPLITSPAKSAGKYLLTKPDGSMEDVFLDPAVLLDSSAVQTTTLTQDAEGRPQIAIDLTAEGATRFAGITARYLHQRIGLVAAGQVFCTPVIAAKISGGDLEISGNFSEQEAREFVALLNENAEPPANKNSSPAQARLPVLPIQLRVSVDSQIRGVVRLKSGQPVPGGTEVELARPPGSSAVPGYTFRKEYRGNDLAYTFDGVSPSTHVSVTVDAPGCRIWQSAEIAVGAGQPEVTAVLEPATTGPVRGQVIDASGQPVAGAIVRALISTPPGRHGSLPLGEDGAQLRTDARGHFQTNRLRVGDTFILWAHDARDGSNSPPDLTRDEVKRQASSGALTLASAGGLDVPALTLQPVGAPAANADRQTGPKLRLSGVIRAKDGQSVPGNVTIQLEQRIPVAGRFSYTIAHHSIGNDLAYTLEGTTDAGRASLLVDAPGFRTWQSADFAVAAEMPPIDALLDSAVPAPVRGRVLDAAGKPVAGAKIGATVMAQPGGGQCGVQLAPDGTVLTTDAQGRFETNRLRVGDSFSLWANDLDFKTPPPANASSRDFIRESRSETLTIADASGLDVPDMVLQPSRRLQPDKHSGMPGDPFTAQDKQEQLQALAALRDVDDPRAKHMILIAALASRQAPFTPAERAVIARFLDSNNPEVLIQAARRLQRMNDPVVLAKLAAALPRMLDDPPEAIELAFWLRGGSFPGASDRAFELFSAWLRDPATRPGPRHVLSFRLPEAVSPKKYAPLYVDLLADADTTVSYNALGRLEELTDDQSFGFDPARAPAEQSAALARWRTWLAQSSGSLPEDTPTEKPAASKAPTWIGARILADPKAETGIWITTLVPGSPAEKAGLRAGDIITAVDGRTLAGRSADQVAAHELQGEAGKPLRLTVHRQDMARPQEIAVVPEPRPASQP
jgi:beta-lactamase regulating signal transducer with metallopeptidase domain/protocatechuate 3,4-dioxygenase beta subunit